MGRASLIQTNFSGGELSPALALGRVDIAKYANGVRRLENCLLTIQGGAKRRPGTRFIRAQREENAPARLVDFIYNRHQAYILEMGHMYVRFLKDRQYVLAGAEPYAVPSPYGVQHMEAFNYVQKADTAFFVHEDVTPHRLQRFGDATWSFRPVDFITPPFSEQGHILGGTLSLSAVDAGAAITVHASDDSFLESDVGRNIVAGGGSARITSFVDAFNVTALVHSPFSSATVPTSWRLDGSPQESIYPSGKGEIGQDITLSSAYTYYQTPRVIVRTKAYPSWLVVNVVGHGYSRGDTVQLDGTQRFDGTYVVDFVTSPDFFSVLASGMTGETTAGTAARLDVATGNKVWRPQDVGKYVEINSGLVRISAYIDHSVVVAEVLRPLSAAVPAGRNAWILESNAWNADNGYPRAVTINAQRLMYAGSAAYPQHLWASAIQGYLDFGFGTADDEAFRYELDGARNSPIRHLCANRHLLVLTESDEMSLKGGQEKAITPTNIQKNDESTAGSSLARPVKVGNEILFVQSARRKLNAAGYRYEIDGFASPDRTVFSSHITGAGITQLCYSKEPDSTVIGVRTDGQLAVCAYDIDQEVTGWGRWITKGAFESVASIPTATGEDTYLTARRTVGGTDRRYVEVFDPDVFLDSCITGSHPTGQATWNGLDHLEGETVQAHADGAYLGEYTVQGGSVTLDRPAKDVQIGLGFNCLIETLQIEVGGNGTTAQGSQVHVNEVIIRVLDTHAAVVNGQKQEFRRFGPGLLDLPPPSFTGDVRSTTLSDQIYRTRQVIEQPYPMPFHLLDVIRRATINEG